MCKKYLKNNSGLTIFSLQQGMKVYRKYLEELYRTVEQIQTEMKLEKSTIRKSPVNIVVKPAQNCEITLLTAPNASTNHRNETKCDQPLSNAQKKCRDLCELMEMLSKFTAKNHLT
jgi:hypothetical protein